MSSTLKTALHLIGNNLVFKVCKASFKALNFVSCKCCTVLLLYTNSALHLCTVCIITNLLLYMQYQTNYPLPYCKFTQIEICVGLLWNVHLYVQYVHTDQILHVCMYVYVCMYGCIRVFMHVCVHVCMYACMYALLLTQKVRDAMF